MFVFWWIKLDLVFLVSRTASSGVFLGVCDRIMILVSLSANGWGCVPVLLVVWHRLSSTVACWSLHEASCSLTLRPRCLGDLFPFDIMWSWEVSDRPMS